MEKYYGDDNCESETLETGMSVTAPMIVSQKYRFRGGKFAYFKIYPPESAFFLQICLTDDYENMSTQNTDLVNCSCLFSLFLPTLNHIL